MTVHVNGVKLYYERYGAGKPVILLHGNGEDHTAMQSAADHLKKWYAVYAIDSRCHGKSQQTATLGYHDMAGDVAAFIRKLGLNKPVLIGSSDGAIVALLVAIHHPELPGKVVSAGANRFPHELKRWFRGMVKVASRLKRDDPKLRLMLNEPNLTDELLKRIACPVLVLAGQRDILAERHTLALAHAIPGAQVKILPGESHTSYIRHGERLLAAAKGFLA